MTVPHQKVVITTTAVTLFCPTSHLLSSGIADGVADRHLSFLKMSQRKLNIAVIGLSSEDERQLASIRGGWGNSTRSSFHL